ncbi:MAG: hypothetical protein WC364_15105 [Eubacteriales bacterium]
MCQAVESNPLRDKWYRLNNLYHITDETGKDVLFRMNAVQERLFEEMWFRNNILKSRQHGITTEIDLYILDEVIFNSNIEAGIIAHRREDAEKIFRRKISYPYNHLPAWILDERKAITDSKSELALSNGSSVFVSVSMRSGTVQYLHISEFGYICQKFPDRAQEIVTGAIEALHAGQILWIESTAAGKEGKHYEYCKIDQDIAKSGRKLTKLDRKFHFFAWWQDARNVLEDSIPINQKMQDYFKELKDKHGIELTLEQKWWYTKKKSDLGDDIKKEHPSTPEEAFEASVEGAYFATQFAKIREDKRICKVPIVDGVLVDTWWDLGLNDLMAIWFTQTVGREIHLVDYMEDSGEGFSYYAARLEEKKQTRKLMYGRFVAPHDIGVMELGPGKTRWESAALLGLKFVHLPRVARKMDSIEAARKVLSICWFDEEMCDKGIARLENYRKQWDDHLGVWKNEPLHDENSNGADAFQTLAMGHDFSFYQPRQSAKPVQKVRYAW